MAEWDFTPVDLDPSWDQPAEEAWKRAFYQSMSPGATTRFPTWHPAMERASMRGMAPAYGAFALQGWNEPTEVPGAFSQFLEQGTPRYGANLPGWADIVAGSGAFGTSLSDPGGWAQWSFPSQGQGTGLDWVSKEYFGGAGEGGLDPDLARSMALARVAPETGYANWAQGMRGQLAARAIQRLQNMYQRAQLGLAPGAEGTLANQTVQPYGQGGFLNWLSQVAPTQFGPEAIAETVTQTAPVAGQSLAPGGHDISLWADGTPSDGTLIDAGYTSVPGYPGVWYTPGGEAGTAVAGNRYLIVGATGANYQSPEGVIGP